MQACQGCLQRIDVRCIPGSRFFHTSMVTAFRKLFNPSFSRVSIAKVSFRGDKHFYLVKVRKKLLRAGQTEFWIAIT